MYQYPISLDSVRNAFSEQCVKVRWTSIACSNWVAISSNVRQWHVMFHLKQCIYSGSHLFDWLAACRYLHTLSFNVLLCLKMLDLKLIVLLIFLFFFHCFLSPAEPTLHQPHRWPKWIIADQLSAYVFKSASAWSHLTELVNPKSRWAKPRSQV